MKRQRNWMQQLLESADLPAEALPGLPVIEVCADQRVLIEHHLGICQYGSAEITVKVAFGWVRITGEALKLACMTKEKLVIRGKLQGLEIIRRNG